MQRILTLAFCLILSAASFAQKNSTIKGIVFDTSSKKGLSYATVSLVDAKDSTLVNFTRADSTGQFKLKQVSKGKYLLSTSYVGFMPVWKKVEVNEGEEMDMGNVTMTDIAHASEITVEAKRPPVVINGDTLEFNSENFKTQPNAVVEDLLKKLPGVTVDADGTVRVNGQRVNRVFVNGRDFFNGDPKMATKNLDADAVDKVQVFDKKSDRSEFTGIDDGNSTKAINLKLKKDRNNAVFGRATAGAGNDGRYDAQTNMNKFNGDKQMSLIGMGNNTNRQGFSISDVMNFTGELGRGMRSGGGVTIRTSTGDDGGNGLPITGMGPNQQGVATTYAGGLNYNNSWKRKTDLNASAMISDINLETNRNSERQYLLPGNNYTYSSNSTTTRNIKQQRLNMSLDHKIDSFTSLKVTPVLTFQQQNSNSFSQYLSQTSSKVKMNEGYNSSSSKSNGYVLGGEALFRHRFRRKGRTISSTFSVNSNHSEQDGTLNTKNTFYTTFPPKDSLLNQINSNDAFTTSIGGNIVYTEPIGKRSLVEFGTFYNSTIGESNRKTYDFNTSSGKHDVLNTNLSNNFKSDYAYKGGSLNFRSNLPKFNYGFGASLQEASLKSINKTTNNTIRQSFTDVLPNANWQYKFSNFRNIRMDYNTSTQQPSTSQLQPLQNINDPLNVVEGNPDLKRSFMHNINVNYFSADPATRKNFFAFAFVSFTQNAIVYADEFQTNGARKTKPINTNGVMNFFSNVSYGFPIKPIKTRLDLSAGFNSMRNVSYINGAKNNITNTSFNPSVALSYGKDNVIDIRTTATLRISKATYSLQEQLNTNYLTQTYGAEMTNYLPWGLVLNNNFNYTINTGRADGYNTKVPFWNASIAKSFLKNKRGEFKISAFDLLNQNIGINRSSNQNYIEDLRYNVLQRYFLATFTFRLHKSAGSGGPQVSFRTFGNE